MQFQRTRITPPAWPRQVQRVRRACFDERFLRSDAPLACREGSWVVHAVSGRSVVGYAQVVPSLSDGESVLEEVAVLHAWRHHGVGETLVLEAARWARELGFSSLSATPLVGPDETLRTAWLARLGLHKAHGSYHAPAGALVESLEKTAKARAEAARTVGS